MNDQVVTNNRHLNIKGVEILEELALNLRWSWYHGSDKVWQELDPELWDLTHNPWIVLETVSRSKLEKALSDPNYRSLINNILATYRSEATTPKWFQKTHPQSPLSCIAYFSMEFMLAEALPIYSGGLGNVAGDQLKAASDLGVPVVGVGLLYQQGYFRQVITKDGEQQALYPYNEPGQLPIKPLRKSDGEWLRLQIHFPGYTLWLRTWEVQVGRVKLYLLDSNDPANVPVNRGITSELYGGGSELRLQQELILGISGWRLLKAIGLNPEVCHLNEGHAAFAVLERAYSFMQEHGTSFEVALNTTRAGNLFTTHTAVPAGFDQFTPALIEQYLTIYGRDRLKISMHDLLALGRLNPNDPQENFNMAYLAIRGSGSINGVSKLHGKVSRQIFSPLFPHWPEEEVPVGYVTNGVHMPSWDFAGADDLWTEACGKDRWLGTTEELEKLICCVHDEKIWNMRNMGRQALIEYTRKRLGFQLASSGMPPDEVERAKHLFDPHTLTLGFARRFATYKRPNILLHDPERLLRILTNPQRPVQLIIAGKAHPADKPGQELIKQWIHFIRSSEARSHVIFLSDYDILLSEKLVQGVDVWINMPRRPWEACGTSGMKVLVNGGLNLSELDGWWAEAYSPEVGWALGDGHEHGDDPAWDAAEASALYDMLEREVIPEFYNRGEKGIPVSWVEKIRQSMARLTPKYSSNRSVREYTDTYYLPSAKKYLERSSNHGALSTREVTWKGDLDHNWQSLHFGEAKAETTSGHHFFTIQIYFNNLNPNAVKVELYADGIDGAAPVIFEMYPKDQNLNESKMYTYTASIPATRPANDFTARVVPLYAGVSVPLEANEILWQR